MALRNQPYLPLYIQDFLTDEKLMECSASATGVYIRIMCIMHKSDPYGTILLKQNDKQTDKQISNFAYKLAKYLPYQEQVIIDALNELIEYEVLSIEGDLLKQKRMIKDNEISEIRSKAGKKGGIKNKKSLDNLDSFAKAKVKANIEAKHQANSEYEYEYENENTNKKLPKIIEATIFDSFLDANCPTVRKLKIQMSSDQAQKLADEFGMKACEEIFEAMENWIPLTKKSKSVYLTARTWLNKRATTPTTKTNGKSKPTFTEAAMDWLDRTS